MKFTKAEGVTKEERDQLMDRAKNDGNAIKELHAHVGKQVELELE